MRIEKRSFLIVSKCEQMIAKGSSRNRYICMVNEKNNKPILSYSSEGRARDAMENSGFFVSDKVVEYLMNTYPQTIQMSKNRRRSVPSWKEIEQLGLMEVREFIESYEEVSTSLT